MITLQVAYPDEDGVLHYRIFNNGVSRKIQGIRAVIQLVTKTLLTDPGTDMLYPAAGAGLQIVLRKSVSQSTLQARQAEIALAVARCESQIIASQSGLNLPPGERLRRIDVRPQATTFDPATRTWRVALKINTEDGNSERALLEA